MNHGYCKNCWWYWPLTQGGYKIENFNVIQISGNGLCYMHNGSYDSYQEVKENSYCPDYCNRKKYNIINKQTLNEWLDEWKNKKV